MSCRNVWAVRNERKKITYDEFVEAKFLGCYADFPFVFYFLHVKYYAFFPLKGHSKHFSNSKNYLEQFSNIKLELFLLLSGCYLC